MKMADERVEQLTAEVAKHNAEIKKKVAARDAQAAKVRKELLAMNEARDVVAAELAAARKLAGLTDTERAAIAAELAKG